MGVVQMTTCNIEELDLVADSVQGRNIGCIYGQFNSPQACEVQVEVTVEGPLLPDHCRLQS